MTLQLTLRRIAIFVAMALAAALYLADLTGAGMLSADEPRYAEIGREMASSGDWITPHLWGAPWFEKPALLYWMTATAFRAGLGPDLAPRLPVAILSLAFLAFFYFWLRREWDAETASYATAMLATSAGWLAYSHVAVTDLPMSAFFAAAVMLAISSRPRPIASAACLAIAALGKGLVPVVLFVPVAWLTFVRDFSIARTLKACATFLAIALPWYVLCTIRNGAEFPKVFFLQQTFGRFNSDALQHAQPWLFYAPVAFLLLYPWFPFLGTVKRAVYDRRTRALAATVVFGFVFFSIMKNKLPGYLLPLLPAACALLAIGYARSKQPRWATASAIILLALLPIGAGVVPAALSNGLRKAHLAMAGNLWLAAIALAIGVASAFARRASFRFGFASVTAAAAMLWFQLAVFPALDRAASARPLWTARRPACTPHVPRAIAYGLWYYAGRVLPPCENSEFDQGARALYGTERRPQ